VTGWIVLLLLLGGFVVVLAAMGAHNLSVQERMNREDEANGDAQDYR
jgi:hypothetical protein